MFRSAIKNIINNCFSGLIQLSSKLAKNKLIQKKNSNILAKFFHPRPGSILNSSISKNHTLAPPIAFKASMIWIAVMRPPLKDKYLWGRLASWTMMWLKKTPIGLKHTPKTMLDSKNI